MPANVRVVPLAVLAAVLSSAAAAPPDPLPSWRESSAKRAILAFVDRVTKAGSPDFVPPEERIATFDNDGTLWSEQPIYFQFQFALDRIRAMAPQHPEWKTTPPFSHVLSGDTKALLAAGEKALVEAVMTAHSGITTAQFEGVVREWFRTAKHPTSHRAYDRMIFQPMVELLQHLRASGFKTFIVSGGGVEFLRVFAEKAYGIPPEQVVGSQGKLRYELRDGMPVLVKLPEIQFVDDGEGKPAGIQTFIGRRPIAAFGNSDGDYQMLEWTTSGDGARFGMIVRHDDAYREWAYDRDSPIGHLEKALDDAPRHRWLVVSMKDDWKRVFPD